MIARLAHWYDCHPVRGEATLAVLGLVVVVLPAELAASVHTAGGLIISVALVACLPVRRQSPVISFAVVCLLCLAQLLLLNQPVSGDVVALIMLYTVVAYDRRWWSGVVATGCALVGALAATMRWEHAEYGVSLVNAMFSTVAVVLVAATVGTWQRSRRAQLATLQEHNRFLAAERDQQAAVGAATERMRIARELHDIVAHSLSIVVVQADGAAAAAAQQPDAAATALRTIAETGRDALGQMRRLLGVLRDGQSAGSCMWAPQPSVAQLAELAAQFIHTGLPVCLSERGPARPLPPAIDTTLYRVAQEALTNVLKHAGAVSRVEVVLDYGGEAVKLSVRDDGCGAAGINEGQRHGLAGMRERVELHDGTLVTGPGPDGGFRVEAMIRTSERSEARV